MITKENISSEQIAAVLGAAFLDHEVVEDGNIVVESDYRLFVSFNSFCITLSTMMGVKPYVSHESLLDTINTLNVNFKIPKSAVMNVGDARAIFLQFILPIGVGIAPRTLIECIREFEGSIRIVAPHLEKFCR